MPRRTLPHPAERVLILSVLISVLLLVGIGMESFFEHIRWTI